MAVRCNNNRSPLLLRLLINRYCCFLLLLGALGQGAIFYRLISCWDCTLLFSSSSSSSSSVVDDASFWLPPTLSTVGITKSTTTSIADSTTPWRLPANTSFMTMGRFGKQLRQNPHGGRGPLQENDNASLLHVTMNMPWKATGRYNNSPTNKTSSWSSFSSFTGVVTGRATTPTEYFINNKSTVVNQFSNSSNHKPYNDGTNHSATFESRTFTSSIRIQPYSQQDIIRLVQDTELNLNVIVYLPYIHKFQLYSIYRGLPARWPCQCAEHIIELVIDGLLTINRSGQTSSSNTTNQYHKPLQLVIDTVSDDAYYPCMDNLNGDRCDKKQHAPLIEIGSVPSSSSTNDNAVPFLHSFPFKHYNNCLYLYRLSLFRHQRHNRKAKRMQCRLHELAQFASTTDDLQVWESLIPQIIWRGSCLPLVERRVQTRHLQRCNVAMLSSNISSTTATAKQITDYLLQQPDSLNPRCYAVALTLQAEIEWSDKNSNISNSTSHTLVQNYQFNHTSINQNKPWINAKFTRNSYHERRYSDWSTIFLGDYMPPAEMAKYKYQIDLGGNGGTTWLGTITKLAMPGLLFHHLTPTKDFFHDDIQPWVHYIPIHTNLSNLYDMFVWAETHPMQAQQIARQGQEYARYLISDQAYAATFQRLFVNRVQQIAAAYQPSPSDGETIESILKQYQASKLKTRFLGTCNAVKCDLSPIKNNKS